MAKFWPHVLFRGATDIVERYKQWDLRTWEDYVHGSCRGQNLHEPARNIIIDDLGQEQPANIYGERLEVLSQVIETRYSCWQKLGRKTFMTTNLSGKQLRDRYGIRILDRILEMCVIIKMHGKSQRRCADD